MSTDIEYTVSFTPFSERHYIKSFEKRYKTDWDRTRISITESFRLFDMLFKKGSAKMIVDKEGLVLCKTEFRVNNTKQSRHTSGNRCIVAVHTNTKEVRVLLVYNKTHLTGSGNETAQWKNLIKQNYPEYKHLL